MASVIDAPIYHMHRVIVLCEFIYMINNNYYINKNVLKEKWFKEILAIYIY